MHVQIYQNYLVPLGFVAFLKVPINGLEQAGHVKIKLIDDEVPVSRRNLSVKINYLNER